jgi:hypothetical protein
MTKIQAETTRQMNGPDAREHIAQRSAEGWREISDSCAVTIAAWWQSPGGVGRHLATLASGLPAEYDDLRDDIMATRAEVTHELDVLALDMLGTWALDRLRCIEGWQ